VKAHARWLIKLKKKNSNLIDEKYLNLPLDDEYMMMFLRPTHYYPESALKRVSSLLKHASFKYIYFLFIFSYIMYSSRTFIT